MLSTVFRTSHGHGNHEFIATMHINTGTTVVLLLTESFGGGKGSTANCFIVLMDLNSGSHIRP